MKTIKAILYAAIEAAILVFVAWLLKLLATRWAGKPVRSRVIDV